MERGLVLIRDSGPTPWDSELPVLEAGAGSVLLLRVRRKEAPVPPGSAILGTILSADAGKVGRAPHRARGARNRGLKGHH